MLCIYLANLPNSKWIEHTKQEFIKELPGIAVYELSAEEVTKQYGIEHFPCMLIAKDGRVFDWLVGKHSITYIKNRLGINENYS